MTLKYIAVCGLEGAGKSSIIQTLEDFFCHEVITKVREPGGTILAEKLRGIVKGEVEGEDLDSVSEALIFFAARNQLLTQVVLPHIEMGNMVISDRCYLSSIAYQRNEMVDLLTSRLAIKPDLIIYLDIDPVVGLERARGRGELDRIEKKDISFFQKAREVYQAEAKANDFIETIDASQSPENVRRDVIALLERIETHS